MFSKIMIWILALFLIFQFVTAIPINESYGNESKETTPKEVKKTVKPIVNVNLCDGCVIGKFCIAVGVQKQEELGSPLYYCDTDYNVKLVKDIGGSCMLDYECQHYFCDKGYCNARMDKKYSSKIMPLIVVFLIILLGVGLIFVYKIRGSLGKLAKEEKKMEKEDRKILGYETKKDIQPKLVAKPKRSMPARKPKPVMPKKKTLELEKEMPKPGPKPGIDIRQRPIYQSGQKPYVLEKKEKVEKKTSRKRPEKEKKKGKEVEGKKGPWTKTDKGIKTRAKYKYQPKLDVLEKKLKKQFKKKK